MSSSNVFTSESVAEGHPDKIADQISDAILDAILKQDPKARVACETFVKTGMVLVGGEITTKAWVDVEEITRGVIRDIGYNSSEMGFDWESCAVLSAIGKQSADIAQGVDNQDTKILGAGDQGMMFGYASRETDVFMPAPIAYAHRLMERQALMRKEGVLPWLRPDGKCQLTLNYENGEPVSVNTIVFSTQHAASIGQHDLIEAVREEIIKPIIPEAWLLPETRYFINPTGRFVIGGFEDAAEQDRHMSYAIGIAEPTSIHVETFGTAHLDNKAIIELIKTHFDLTPQGIIDHHDLLRPIYQQTATYGHYGREHLPWERLDKVSELRRSLL